MSTRFDVYGKNDELLDVKPMQEWCKQNIHQTMVFNDSEVYDGKSTWSCCPWAAGRHWTFFFINDDDAIKFKLRWL